MPAAAEVVGAAHGPIADDVVPTRRREEKRVLIKRRWGAGICAQHPGGDQLPRPRNRGVVAPVERLRGATAPPNLTPCRHG